MKKLKCLLLSSLIIVLFSEHSFSQMILSNYHSTERSIPNTSIQRVMPIKTEKWKNSYMISLVHYGSNKYTNGRFLTQGNIYYHKDACVSSVFYLTEESTNVTKRVIINNYTITDFCIANDTIYMCGQNNTNNNFIAYEAIMIFFNTNNLLSNIFHLSNMNSSYTLTNIDFCISEEYPTLLLLANQNNSLNSYFIAYNLITNSSIVYSSNVRLLDITQTDNYIAVLGMGSDSTFTLTRHAIHSIPNYIGKKFITGVLYTHFSDPKYHLVSLQKNQNHVVVAESTNNMGGLEFNIIDLNTLTILQTQAILDTREGRSKIMDLKFNEQRNILYCLFCNGANDTRDMILQIFPYNSQTINYSLVSKPQTYSTNYNLLKDLTLYRNNSQVLVFGRTPGLDVYFFDRMSDFNSAGTCDKVESFNCGVVESPKTKSLFNYTPFNPIQIQPLQPQLNRSNINYSIICQ